VADLEESVVSGPTTSGTGAAQAAPSKLDDLPSLAAGVGVDEKAFSSCFDDGKYSALVQEQYEGGLAFGITGTPGNIIMNRNGQAWLLPGAVPYETVAAVVEVALGNATTVGGGIPIEELSAEQVAKIPPVSEADHMMGNSSAQVYLIEYSDLQCPYCQKFHPTATQIKEEYDQLAWVYRHFPLDSIHPKARPAALASECVTELGGNEAFWKFVGEVFGS
jgi:protein-disulfide isomerase